MSGELMNPALWRAPTREELLSWFDKSKDRSNKTHVVEKADEQKTQPILAIRQKISPVDMYCYLKARFGKPNGFQNFLRKDDSDNLIHWDYMLMTGDSYLYICSLNREIHIMPSSVLSDEQWRDLIIAIKTDFGRVGPEKGKVLKSLEKWVVFPNRFAQIADVCADFHSEIKETKRLREITNPSSGLAKAQFDTMQTFGERAHKIYRSALELKLLTPVLAEAFIKMTIIILCKSDIRSNERQFDAFIRSNIDAKIFDIPYKCTGFVKTIDHNSSEFKNFKRVMDKRNNTIHGNIDPQREKVEDVYFKSKIPLFAEPGDAIVKYFDALERQYDVDDVVADYEHVHEFLIYITNCIEPGLREAFWDIIQDEYPGYDVKRHITGKLFPGHVVGAYPSVVKYDDELQVIWP